MKTKEFPALSENFAIKTSKKEIILLDLVNGKGYELDLSQLEFVRLLNGENSVEEIIGWYIESREEAIALLESLRSMEVIDIQKERGVVNLKEVIAKDGIKLQDLHLEITSRCNMRCLHCYQGDCFPISNNLTLQEIKKVIAEAGKMGAENIGISGGEPLLLIEQLGGIISYIESNNMRFSALFTNGLIVDEKLIDIISNCRSSPTIFVSLDSITPEGMEFRGINNKQKESLETILSNIKKMTDNGIRVAINTTLNKHNIGSLADMHETIIALGVIAWRIGFPKKTGFFVKNNDEFGADFQEMLKRSLELVKHHRKKESALDLQIEYLYRKEFLEPGGLSPIDDETRTCDYEGRADSCCVKPDGSVSSCAYISAPLGNIRENSLYKIWNSPEMRRRKGLRVKDVSECRSCELRKYCGAGCRMNSYFINKDYFNAKDNDSCKAVKFFVEKVKPYLETIKN